MMIKTTRSWWMIGLIAATALTAACGDDGDDKKDPTPTPDMAADMTPDQDVNTPDDGVPDANMPDEGTPDSGVDMPVDMAVSGADVPEVEPNNMADEEVDDSTPFDAGQSIGGNIAAGSGDNIDVDVYSVELEAGEVFEWEISALGNGFSPGGVLTQLADAEGNITRVLSGDVGAKRQAFAPVTGTYYLLVIDARAAVETPPQHGGPEATYVIKTSTAALAPTAATVPGSLTGDAADGDLKAYSFTWTSSQALNAAATGTVAVTAGGFDPELYLWDIAAEEVVAANFDIDAENDDFNSSLDARPETGKQYALIVDAYDKADDARFSLVTTEIDDAFDAPGALVVGTPSTGVIAAADAANEKFDSDFYDFVVPAGKTIKVTITGAGGLQPTAYIPGFLGAIVDTRPVGDKTAFTLTNPDVDDAAYTLIVDDIRNIPQDAMDEPDFVGGAGFTYSVVAEEITFAQPATALPVTQASTLPLGEYVWYKVTVPASRALELGATTSFAGAELAVVFIDEDGFIGGAAPGAVFFNTTARELVVGITDAFFQGTNGATVYNFTPAIALLADFASAAFVAVADNGANNTPATAQAVVLPAQVTGAADDEAGDHYKVTLAAGQKVIAYTDADINAADSPDTTLEVLNAAGMQLAFNDDRTGDVQSLFSAVTFTAPAAGEYTFVVYPFDDQSFGGYILRVVDITTP